MKFSSKYINIDENRHIFEDFTDCEELKAISSPYKREKIYIFKQHMLRFKTMII
jgi:hypothetical protein